MGWFTGSVVCGTRGVVCRTRGVVYALNAKSRRQRRDSSKNNTDIKIMVKFIFGSKRTDLERTHLRATP